MWERRILIWAALDHQVHEEDKVQPSISFSARIKNRTVAEYALHDARKHTGAATYRVIKRLLKAFEGQSPSPREIARLLEVVDK